MYGFNTHLKIPLDAAASKVAKALNAEGFGALTDIDLPATLRAKLNIAHRLDCILGIRRRASRCPRSSARNTSNP
jgi:uncharacterized protein (DUF302 family)